MELYGLPDLLEVLKRTLAVQSLDFIVDCAKLARVMVILRDQPQKGAKTSIFLIFSTFLEPGTGSKAFSRPWHRISRQKCRIWMRICRDMTIFVIFEKFESVLRVLERFLHIF